MNSKVSLCELLREHETPQMVANHLGVAVQAVYSQMRHFRIQLNRRLLRQTIEATIGEGPGLSVDGAADTLGVRKLTARRAMSEIAVPQLTTNASEEERRIRAALAAAGGSPLIAAHTLRLELTVMYERMNEHGIRLPCRRYTMAERRRILQQIRVERPCMRYFDIAILLKMSIVTLRAALREPQDGEDSEEKRKI